MPTSSKARKKCKGVRVGEDLPLTDTSKLSVSALDFIAYHPNFK